MPQDLGQEDVVGHVLGLKLVAADSSSSMSREHLAQGHEIVLHNLVEPVRAQNVVNVGKHV